MTVVALPVTSVVVSALYRAAIEEEGVRLEETVRAQARLIEAVFAEFPTFPPRAAGGRIRWPLSISPQK